MKFELVTPNKLEASFEATHVRAPGTEGDFGVLNGHMNLISTLRDGGEVEVTDEKGKVTTYIVGGGFVEVTADSVTVLAESIS